MRRVQVGLPCPATVQMRPLSTEKLVSKNADLVAVRFLPDQAT